MAIETPRTILRIDLRNWDGAAPENLLTRMTPFSAMRLSVIGVDGSMHSRIFGPDDMEFATNDWLMRAPLPQTPGSPVAIVAEVDGARHVGMLTDAMPEPSGPDPAALRTELLLAALCGMLCLPLLFNFVFYRVLRQRFVLWHAVAVMCMLVHTFVTSGIINRFFDLSMNELSALSAFSWAFGIAAAAIFICDLIEPGKIDPVQERLLRMTAIWTPAWTMFYVFVDGSLRPLAAPVYYASFIPIVALFAWVMFVARMRGSRAIVFQIAAWLPIMITGAIRMGSALGLADAPMEMQVEQHISIALEVILTSLGVADRFMVIKRERDRAIAETKLLEDRADRDPLTGLLNRRGIEDRFVRLQRDGFDTMAVIDLDHFKRINDTHGHAAGDDVLRSVARALAPDPDTIAFRLGGEEFLLLLRGKDAALRAERRRVAISGRIAADIPGLDCLVTASMGMIEQPFKARTKADFQALYAGCDRLLYEAKRNGRNRTMSERIQTFAKRPRSRAAAA